MSGEQQLLAFDLGAESGRAVLVTLDDERVEMTELHRFPNRPVRLEGTLYWDFPFLYAEILAALRLCAERGVPLVVGTTVLDEGQLEGLRQDAEKIPVVFAPNMSIGVNLLFKLTKQVAEVLGLDYNVEITEAQVYDLVGRIT